MRRSADYYAYLASPAWGAVRARIFASRLRQCERCGAFGCILDLHHKSYARFGNESDEDLMIVCRSCHDRIHSGKRPRSKLLGAIAAAQRGAWRR